MDEKFELNHVFVDQETGNAYEIPPETLKKLTKFILKESDISICSESEINNLDFNKTSSGKDVPEEQKISVDNAYNLKQFLLGLRKYTVKINGVLEPIGRKLLAFLLQAIKMFPNTASSMIIIGALHFVANSIPIFGHILDLLLIPVDLILIATAVVKDIIGSKAFMDLYNHFAEPLLKTPLGA